MKRKFNKFDIYISKHPIKVCIIIIIILFIIILSAVISVEPKTWDKIDNFEIVETEKYLEPEILPGWDYYQMVQVNTLRLYLFDIGVKNKYQYVKYDSSITIEYNIRYHSQLTINKVDSMWNYCSDEKLGLKLRRIIRYHAKDRNTNSTVTF